MNRAMLRFRPIAPKPADGDTPAEDYQKKRVGSGAVRRTKRKYDRVRGYKKTKSQVDDGEVTLQLLPPAARSEIESEKKTSPSSCSCYSSSADIIDRKHQYDHGTGGVTAATWIVVERVTDSYCTVNNGVVGLGLGEGIMSSVIENLKGDTCPSFVSDAANNVVWINEAYRRTVKGAEAEAVRLVVGEEEQLPYFSPWFACRVRMVEQTKQGQKRNNRTVACEVWRMRMDYGHGAFAFAWKLDVQTAICLGTHI